MSQPFNLDAVLVEAEDAPPFPFTWGGEQYEIPLMAALPFETQLALETSNDLEAVTILLGEDITRKLAASTGLNGRKLSIARFGALLDAWFEHQGLQRGKSPASPASSASTARPSRPTSRSVRGRKTS